MGKRCVALSECVSTAAVLFWCSQKQLRCLSSLRDLLPTCCCARRAAVCVRPPASFCAPVQPSGLALCPLHILALICSQIHSWLSLSPGNIVVRGEQRRAGGQWR